jgi:mono/diheme cytochrome c family protein
MRYILLTFALLVAVVVSFAGFRGTKFRQPPLEIFPDMKRQPKLRPETANAFFQNHMSSRLPLEGTVAQSIQPIRVGTQEIYPWQDNPVTTGRVPGTTNFVATSPLPLTAERLAQGQRVFNITCATCHTRVADGNPVAKRIGAMGVIANLHDKRIVELPDGEIFNTITYGKNNMFSYADKLSPEERWAVIAYLRTLQLSRLATVDDLPQAARDGLPK